MKKIAVIDTMADMTEDERRIYKVLSKTMPKSISEIVSSVGFGKSRVTGLLKAMGERKIVKVEGRGRGTKYRLEE